MYTVRLLFEHLRILNRTKKSHVFSALKRVATELLGRVISWIKELMQSGKVFAA